MIKFFAVMLILLVCTVSQCAAKCIDEIQFSDHVMVCSSFEDFLNSSQEGNTWSSVEIHSKPQEINTTILTSVPHIQSIYFNGSVNYINDLTFAAPSHLESIIFQNCELPIIRENSFVFNSDSNVTLIIQKSKVNYLEANCFAKSLNLSLLALEENNITKINVNVFNGTLIAHLYLNYNNIKFIEKNALSNMPRLRQIYLNGNFLTSFDAKLYINNVPNLEFLNLKENKIEFLIKNNFISFPKLDTLYLDTNKIRRIEDGAFNGLTKLTCLDIANNSLYSLPERTFPYNGLPSLIFLEIANNRLNYLPKYFLQLFPKLEWIGIFENPWQCACYRDIMKALSYTNVSINCAADYLDGWRPVCVVPRTGEGECIDNMPDSKELYKTFTEGVKEYESSDFCIASYFNV